MEKCNQTINQLFYLLRQKNAWSQNVDSWDAWKYSTSPASVWSEFMEGWGGGSWIELGMMFWPFPTCERIIGSTIRKLTAWWGIGQGEEGETECWKIRGRFRQGAWGGPQAVEKATWLRTSQRLVEVLEVWGSLPSRRSSGGICWTPRGNGGKWVGSLVEYLNAPYLTLAYENANTRSLWSLGWQAQEERFQSHGSCLGEQSNERTWIAKEERWVETPLSREQGWTQGRLTLFIQFAVSFA